MSEEGEANVRSEIRGDVMVLTLDNERKLNALTPKMMDDLERAADAAEGNSAVRALVLTGSGTRAFCAGADITAWGELDPFVFARRWIRGGHRVFDRLARLAIPTIGALNGHAFGGGLELAACCDIRIAVQAAELALPETSIGIAPGWSGVQRLARLMPQGLIREMALTGGRIPASRAREAGFLNEVVAADALARAMEIAQRAARLAPRAVEIAKLVLNAEIGEGREAALDALAGGLAATTEDKAEGVRSFAEKRPPKFQGR